MPLAGQIDAGTLRCMRVSLQKGLGNSLPFVVRRLALQLLSYQAPQLRSVKGSTTDVMVKITGCG